MKPEFDWVLISAGEFLMGSETAQDPLANENELPQHHVYLPDYRLARTEVTVAQYELFVNETGYKTTAEREGFSWTFDGKDWTKVEGAAWNHPRGTQDDVTAKANHPVTAVSWYDAIAFCDWAEVRLPSEAEWEKAARGTDGRLYPWGNTSPDAARCNFAGNVGDTTPVNAYPQGASPYGVLDMAGNVREWLNTQWGLYGDVPTFGYPYDARDGREERVAPDDFCRCMRERGFYNSFRGVRCAHRYANPPTHRDMTIGFRVAEGVYKT